MKKTPDWTDITWRGVPAPRERLVLTKERLRVLTGIQAGSTTHGPTMTPTRVMTEETT